MKRDSLAVVGSYENSAEADAICGTLVEHGIPATVVGDHLTTTLWHYGTALGGVKVLVPAEDVERAAELIRTLRRPDSATDDNGDWYCGACQEEVDSGFELCWSCGKSRLEVARERPAREPAGAIEPTDVTFSEEQATLPARPRESTSNPYAAPQVAQVRESPVLESTEEEFHAEAEAILLRAWRASIMGLVTIPLVLHLYSMFLLVQAGTYTHRFSPAGNWRFYGALAINMAIIALLGTPALLLVFAWN